MYCHCGAKFTPGEVRLAPKDWQAVRAQYCGTCGNLSHALQEENPVMYAPLGGTAPGGWEGKSDGTSLSHWFTSDHQKITVMNYSPYPFKKVNDMDQGRDHLLKLWQKLDITIDYIRSSHTIDEFTLELKKSRATTLAEVLAQLMSPFYADINAVLVESMARWEARQAGVEHQSPGLAEKVWDPLERVATMRDAPARPARPAAKPKVTLDDQKRTFIKHCLENGSQTPETLATMFGVTVDDIKAVVS